MQNRANRDFHHLKYRGASGEEAEAQTAIQVFKNRLEKPRGNVSFSAFTRIGERGSTMAISLKTLSNCNLMDSTEKVLTTMRRVDVALLEHLAEIERRELHLQSGYSSLFKMCTDKFRLSEASAYRRVAAARLVRKYPLVKVQLLNGEVSMCTLAMVAGKIGELADDDARVALLTAVAGKSKSQVEEWLIQRSGGGATKKRDVIRPMRAAQKPLVLTQGQKEGSTALGPSAPLEMAEAKSLSPAQPVKAAEEKISFRIAFTASEDFRQKLRKAQKLLKHKHPSGNLEAVLEEALDQLLKSRDLLQKKTRRIGTVPTNPRHIPASVKRHVMARDGGRCTFTSAEGHACRETARIEFEHRVPFALGGSSVDPENIELLCRSHNAWRARQVFGKARELSGGARRVDLGRHQNIFPAQSSLTNS